MKKYELIKEDGQDLLRIKYLIDIPRYSIKAGDLGGLLESEDNLSHEGDCVVLGNAKVFGTAWVYGNARVSENTMVYENASVYGNARVSGSAKVYESAWVFGNALVYGNAKVYESAWVFGNARVFGYARVYGNAKVSNNSKIRYSNVTSTVIGIQGSKGYINLDGEYIHIGCKGHKIDYWLDNYESIGKDNGYNEDEILEYGDLIKVLVNYKAIHGVKNDISK